MDAEVSEVAAGSSRAGTSRAGPSRGGIAGWLVSLGLLAAVGGGVPAAMIGVGERDPTDAEIREHAFAMVRAATAESGLDGPIAAALDRDSPEDAEDLIQLADAMGLPVDPALRTRFTEETGGWRAKARALKRAGTGFVTGEGEDDVSLAAAIVSDLTVVGDIRSLGGETLNYLRGQPVDEFIVGLSVAGVGMTAATLTSGGAALPARVGVSVMKVARAGKRLTKAFSAELSALVARTADLPGLRRRIAAGEDSLTATYRHAAALDATALRRVVGSVGGIGEATSARTALGVLRHVDDLPELGKAERVAKAMRASTGGAFRVVGKGLLGAAGAVAVFSWQLLAALAMAAFGILSSLAGLIFGAILWRIGRRILSGPGPAAVPGT